MKPGKLPNSELEKLILNDLVARRSETVLRPAIGEDCCALNLSDDLCVISTDPITAADENAGLLAVIVSLNDLAACGAEPVGILTTVLLPVDIDKSRMKKLFDNINSTCARFNIDVLGGHTEITESVNKTVIITTAIGRVAETGLIRSDGSVPGDSILMTKAAGIEGTAIIASDLENELAVFLTENDILKAKSFIGEISVLEEGLAASAGGAHAMHDITEGGVLGAVWEMCSASGHGAEIITENIPVREITERICSRLDINPLKLISSGSMLITCSPDDKPGIMSKIKAKGISCTEIGVITENPGVYKVSQGCREIIPQPEADELYKVI